MIYPEIRNIFSRDLAPPNLPEDPLDCEVFFQAAIGPADGEGEELFTFSVITPARLARHSEPQWGRGKLIMPAFDWNGVVQAMAQLLTRCAAATWNDVAQALDKELCWNVDVDEPADA